MVLAAENNQPNQHLNVQQQHQNLPRYSDKLKLLAQASFQIVSDKIGAVRACAVRTYHHLEDRYTSIRDSLSQLRNEIGEGVNQRAEEFIHWINVSLGQIVDDPRTYYYIAFFAFALFSFVGEAIYRISKYSEVSQQGIQKANLLDYSNAIARRLSNSLPIEYRACYEAFVIKKIHEFIADYVPDHVGFVRNSLQEIIDKSSDFLLSNCLNEKYVQKEFHLKVVEVAPENT